MVFVFDVDTQASELAHESLDLFFDRISPHITDVSVVGSAQNLIDDPSQTIGNGHLGLVG